MSGSVVRYVSRVEDGARVFYLHQLDVAAMLLDIATHHEAAHDDDEMGMVLRAVAGAVLGAVPVVPT